MTSPTTRALELLELLQSAGTRTVRELAERLRVDERTVRRHVERLRDLGIPVESIRGPSGGYRMASGYRMPPLMLDADEAVAVMAALAGARVSGTRDGSAAATALAKIRRSLPRHLAEQGDALVTSAVVDRSGLEEQVAAPDPETLLGAASAVRDRHPVAMTYTSGAAVTRRTVQPHDLVARGGRWYLVGLDSASGERRTFRLDRIRCLRMLRGTFPPPPEHDALELLVDDFARADYRHVVRVRIRATVDHVRRHLPASVAILDEVPSPDAEGAWLRVTIRAQSLAWLPSVLLALESPVIIEQPEELRREMLAAAERLTAMGTSSPECGQRPESCAPSPASRVDTLWSSSRAPS